MLATDSIKLTGDEGFREAFSLIPDVEEPQIRYLNTEEGEFTGCYQFRDSEEAKWSSPRMLKCNSEGKYILPNFNSKEKLKNTEILYNTFSNPVYAGADKKFSWLIGDINNCNIMGEDYNIQGLIISSIFDPTPKYYISFERLVCQNQFGSLGTSNSSMYINMNKFLTHKGMDKITAKDELCNIVNSEIEKRIAVTEEVYNRLLKIKLDDSRVKEMFRKLTVDTVAKNSESYNYQVENYERYLKAYNCDDNQNYIGTFLGFINSCTNYNTRTKTTPLDVVKPVISPSIIQNPCNLEYLFRDVLVNAS